MYMAFAKLFPIISMWEIKEGLDEAVPEVTDRFRSYMPAAPSQGRRPGFGRIRARRYATTAAPSVVRGGQVRRTSGIKSPRNRVRWVLAKERTPPPGLT